MKFSPEHSALRGIGSSAVVASHSLGFLFALGILPLAAVTVLARLGSLGWLGVSLFLALSIYLLLGSLDAGCGLARYFRRRIVRIWPLYFGAVLAVWILATDHSLSMLAWNISFLAIFDPAHGLRVTTELVSSDTYVVWTLQLEEWAYLSFPLVAVLSHRWRLVLALVLLVVGVTAGVVGVSYFTAWPWMGAYGAGLLAYEARGIDWSTWRWPALGLVPVAFYLGWPLGVPFALPAVAAILVIPPTFLRRPQLVAVGEESYALYLFHLIFLDYLSLAGVPLAYAFSWGAESLQRGRQMRERVALARADRALLDRNASSRASGAA